MSPPQHDRLRDLLAQEAAKIIATEGVRDYQRAKIKASERLTHRMGKMHQGCLPSNFEIEQAIISFHNTFSLEHHSILAEFREQALQVMHTLERFSPYLVGDVLEGTINTNTVISLHAFTEILEEVIEEIQTKYATDVSTTERTYTLNGSRAYIPTILFNYQDFEFEISVFSFNQRGQKPKSKSQKRSMQRINTKALAKLIHIEYAQTRNANDRLD